MAIYDSGSDHTAGEGPAEQRSGVTRLHAIVRGHVQGVFFRAHTRRWALDLNLRGYVRNRADGTVEVVAEGERKALEQLLAKLHKGPPEAWVQGVDVRWEPATGEFWSFEMRY